MGILLCEQNFRHVWIRNKSVRAEIGQILRTHTRTHARAHARTHARTHTHTHTTAAKLVVRMPIFHVFSTWMVNLLLHSFLAGEHVHACAADLVSLALLSALSMGSNITINYKSLAIISPAGLPHLQAAN